MFGLPVTHPNYMPVVRDLSTAKRDALLSWLDIDHPPYMRTDTVEDVQRALQQAIELEHATIPTYLFALFSIKDGRNREVAEIINSVVLEEMLHMALACNVLNAIGGDPQIGGADFIPRYPGKLPGGLRPDLTVSLRKASIEQVRDVFMAIEEPEETDHPKAHHSLTIGWFYSQIERGAQTAGRAAIPACFSHNPDRQLCEWRGTRSADRGPRPRERPVRAAGDRRAGRRNQGQGREPERPRGRLPTRSRTTTGSRRSSAGAGWSCATATTTSPARRSASIPTACGRSIDDPDPDRLHGDSLARRRAYQFDELYAGLLAKLHEVFNGSPDQLNTAIELMFSLEVAAKRLMQTPIAPGSPRRWARPSATPRRCPRRTRRSARGRSR